MSLLRGLKRIFLSQCVTYTDNSEKGIFDQIILPMKGKRKQNGHKEKRGKQAFKRNIVERLMGYSHFKEEFGHLEGNTIVGIHHKSAVVTLVERLSKAIITLKPNGRKAQDIEAAVKNWLRFIPKNLFKAITFDCEKEFFDWKTISNQNDLAIYFSDPETPSQRALNEHSNRLLRKDGLSKEMDFNQVDQLFVSGIASIRKKPEKIFTVLDAARSIFKLH